MWKLEMAKLEVAIATDSNAIEYFVTRKRFWWIPLIINHNAFLLLAI